MSEQGEFYAEQTQCGSVPQWSVRRWTGGRSEFTATFQGAHAEADAREHAAKCNARAKAGRRPRYIVCECDGGYSVWQNGGSRLACFYGDRARAEAEAYAGSLIARGAEADPAPPKGPRYVVERCPVGPWEIRDTTCPPGSFPAVEIGTYDLSPADRERIVCAVADMLNREAGT